MSSFQTPPSSSNVTPLRLGVTFRPPTLVLLYRTSKKQVRRRVMPVRDLAKSSDCYARAQQMRRQQESHLGQVPAVRIEKFLRLLQEAMKGRRLEEGLEAVRSDFALDLDEDMNRLTDQQLQRRKELMDINFAKNQIKVGDPDFVWDKKVSAFYDGTIGRAGGREGGWWDV